MEAGGSYSKNHILQSCCYYTSGGVNRAKNVSSSKPPAPPSSCHHLHCRCSSVHELEILKTTDSTRLPEPTTFLKDGVATCGGKDWGSWITNARIVVLLCGGRPNIWSVRKTRFVSDPAHRRLRESCCLGGTLRVETCRTKAAQGIAESDSR